MPIDPIHSARIDLDTPHSPETSQSVKQVQHSLNLLQGKPGLAEDGVFGVQTQAALRDFQKTHDLPVSGAISQPVVEALNQAVAQKTAAVKGGEAGSAVGAAPIGLRGEHASAGRLMHSRLDQVMRPHGGEDRTMLDIDPFVPHQMARMVIEQPERIPGLLENPGRLAETFGKREQADYLEPLFRTVVELHSRGSLEAGIKPGDPEAFGAAGELAKRAGVEHAESIPGDHVAHNEHNVDVHDEHSEHTDNKSMERVDEYIRTPSNVVPQELIAHVVDNLDQMAEFQKNPAQLAERFGAEGALGKIQMVLDLAQQFTTPTTRG